MTTYDVLSESNEDTQIGKKLPKSFHGHPAKMKASTIDALAVVARKGKPTAMITITCNGNWEAIRQTYSRGKRLTTGQTFVVFKIKVAELLKDLRSDKLFGPVTYEMSVVEWQKRGMPHMHLIVPFEGPSPDQTGEMDDWCWAEVPRADLNNGKSREQVLNLMVHRQYGAHNVSSPCMQDDRTRPGVKVCGKRYPQPWRSSGTVNSNTGRAEYKQRRKIPIHSQSQPQICGILRHQPMDCPI